MPRNRYKYKYQDINTFTNLTYHCTYICFHNFLLNILVQNIHVQNILVQNIRVQNIRVKNILVQKNLQLQSTLHLHEQGCIFRLMCSHPELTEDHVLTSAYVKIFRIVTRNAVNKSF